MSADSFKRKITAILSADVKGYSRLGEDDELVTVRTCEANRKTLAEITRNYRGQPFWPSAERL